MLTIGGKSFERVGNYERKAFWKAWEENTMGGGLAISENPVSREKGLLQSRSEATAVNK